MGIIDRLKKEAGWKAREFQYAGIKAHEPEMRKIQEERRDYKYEQRQQEDWFDTRLFILAEDRASDTLVGFNWLKVHGASRADERTGEIYVIGVAPDAQGSGLGRALVVAGLERLARKRFGRAMLYVAADNDAAIGLYRSLGFRLTRTDQAFTTTIRPA